MAKAVRKSPSLDYQGASQSVVINHLDVRPVVRQTLDIKKWRNATILAEGLTQNRVGLYDIYDDVLIDLILFRAIEKRIIHITNLPIVFIDSNGQRNDKICDLAKKLFFRQMLRYIMESIFWGHSLIELNWTEKKPNTKLVARKHVKPRYKIVTTNQNDTSGVNYDDDKMFYNYLEVGDSEDLGLLLKVAPYALWKRADIGDWSEFVELFGMPSTLGKYTNPETRKVLREAFDKMGGRPRLIIPNDAQVEMQESKSANGDGGLFNTFREALNEEMTIGVLGNTMTTIEAKSSGYAQSETQHKDQSELKKDDRAFVLSVLNENLVGYLIRERFTQGGEFQFMDDEHLSMTQRLAIDLQLHNIVPIDTAYWYEKYKLPMPTVPIEAKQEAVIPEKKPKKGQNLHLSEQDGSDDAANSWLKSLYSDNRGDDSMIQHYYNTLNTALREAVSTEVGIRYGQDWAFDIGLQADAMRFAVFKNHAAKNDMLKLMTTDSGMLKPFSTWKKDVASLVNGYNQDWLQAEYQTAVASARMGVKWQQFERRKSVYPNLHYKTQHDDRVRPSHALMDGIVRPMDDVFWKTNYPPNGWRCFTPETMILTAEGWSRIEGLQAGQQVIGGSGVPQTIEFVHSNDFDGHILRLIHKKEHIMTTPNHRILTLKGWMRADSLEVGDIIIQLPQISSKNKIIFYINHVYTIFRNFLMTFPCRTLAIDTLNANVELGQENIYPITSDILVKDRLKTATFNEINHILFALGWFLFCIRMILGKLFKVILSCFSRFFHHFGSPKSRSCFQFVRNLAHQWTIFFCESLSRVSAFNRFLVIHLSQDLTCFNAPFRIIKPLTLDCIASPARLHAATSKNFHQLARLSIPTFVQFSESEKFVNIQTAEGFTDGAPLNGFDSLNNFIRYAFFHYKFIRIDKIEEQSYHGKVFNLSVKTDESYITSLGIVHNCRCNVIQTDLPPTEVLPEGESLPPPIFQHNSGMTGRLFAPYHPYYEVSAQNKEASERIATQLQNQAHEAHAKESAQAVRKSFVPKQFDLNGKQASVSISALTILDSDFEPKLKAARNYCLSIIGDIAQQLQFSEIVNGLHYYLYSFDYFGEAYIFKLVFDEHLSLKNIIL